MVGLPTPARAAMPSIVTADKPPSFNNSCAARKMARRASGLRGRPRGRADEADSVGLAECLTAGGDPI